jgi:hypothetical protein
MGRAVGGGGVDVFSLLACHPTCWAVNVWAANVWANPGIKGAGVGTARVLQELNKSCVANVKAINLRRGFFIKDSVTPLSAAD